MGKRSHQVVIPEVGSKVTLRFGGREVEAVVVEHRGPIGVGGRQLLRVRVTLDKDVEPVELELPVSEVQAAA